jgi:hypothetical protein
MGTLVRLRIALADRPGSLATVAAVIADAGGNIQSVDVHRSGMVSAVDDVVVDFPDDVDLVALRTRIADSDAATLLSHQEARATDPIVSVLTRAAAMLASPATDAEEELVRSVAELCSSPVVWVASGGAAEAFEAGRAALEGGGAVAVRTAQLPPDLAERLAGEVWLLAVPDPELLAGSRVVFVARPLGSEFTTTEISRIEAVMVLHHQLTRLLSGG